jgi:ribosomal protein L9
MGLSISCHCNKDKNKEKECVFVPAIQNQVEEIKKEIEQGKDHVENIKNKSEGNNIELNIEQSNDKRSHHSISSNDIKIEISEENNYCPGGDMLQLEKKQIKSTKQFK